MQKALYYLFCLLALAGCAITRSSVWNDEDSRCVAQAIASSVLDAEWYAEFIAPSGFLPVLMLGDLTNAGTEMIELHRLREELTRELLASGKVRLVKQRSGNIDVSERSELSVSPPSPQDCGADIVLQGAVQAFLDEPWRIYRLDLKLTRVRDGKVLHEMHEVVQQQQAPNPESAASR
jgi:hypothetical protein